MKTFREPSTTTDDRRMIDAWVANRPPGLDPERQLDDRWAAEGLMIRKAIAREAPLPAPWKDDVEPALLR